MRSSPLKKDVEMLSKVSGSLATVRPGSAPWALLLGEGGNRLHGLHLVSKMENKQSLATTEICY